MSNEGGRLFFCDCHNEYQDKRYGKGRRWHNNCKNPVTKLDMKGARCTVCGKVKPL